MEEEECFYCEKNATEYEDEKHLCYSCFINLDEIKQEIRDDHAFDLYREQQED